MRLLRIFSCSLNLLLIYKILSQPFLTNLYYQKSGSSISSVSFYLLSIVSTLDPWDCSWNNFFGSFFRAARKEAIIIFWTIPIEYLEIVVESLSALINIKLSLRDVFLKKIKKLDKFRHAFMDWWGHVERGGNMEASLPCVWARWNPVCLDGTYHFGGDESWKTSWHRVNLRWSFAQPKGEGISPMAAGSQYTYLQWSSMLIWILSFSDKAMWSVE